MIRHFLQLDDLDSGEILHVLARGMELKRRKHYGDEFGGKILGLLFEKESTRTRVSFEVAIKRLGGDSIYIGQGSSQISRGETYADSAQVLSRYIDAIVWRGFSHKNIVELAEHSKVPVINGLSDSHHPCQLLADLMTILESGKKFFDVCVLYVGDGNNMCHSWMEAAFILGINLKICCPQGYGPDKDIIKKFSVKNITLENNPQVAVRGVDYIYTDTWFSMGQKVTKLKRDKFRPFQVNQKLLDSAGGEVRVMHCLPAHRGEEITDEVMDGSQSVIFAEAENRLWAQMALLEVLLNV